MRSPSTDTHSVDADDDTPLLWVLFDTYLMVRMNEAPKVEVHIVRSAEPPGGMGEPGTSAVVPAIANAIFAATGKRLRRMPIDAGALKRA